jgi:hypothetical protein
VLFLNIIKIVLRKVSSEIDSKDGRQSCSIMEKQMFSHNPWHFHASFWKEKDIRLEAGFRELWWCMPVIPALGKLRQEDSEFEVSWATY